MAKAIRNIGIFAHADAGKTTITENFLFACGKIKLLGSVDKGTTQTDYLKVEKERGISVRSSYTSFEYKDSRINLIDTPGHIDFSADLERSLRITDAAILVISAAEGVQAHTETIWNGLKEKNIPIIIFINKIDRSGADFQIVIEEIEKELTPSLAVINEAINEGDNNASIQSIWNTEILNEKTLETLSETNDDILEHYLDGKAIDFEKADNALIQSVADAKIYPLLTGSAKNSIGIRELLEAVIRYFPISEGKEEDPLSALVFGISHDKTFGKTAYVRVFNGQINKRELIYNYTRKTEEKITQVRKTFAGSYQDIGFVSAGDIASLSGLKDAQVGDILGQTSEFIPEDISLKTALLTVQVKPEQEKDFADLAYALQDLSKEDPGLDFDRLKDEKELHLKIMGRIQMQVLESVLEDRFDIKAKFEEPTIIYKETPSKNGEGFVKYWMPKPCWAVLTFKIEAGERGSGVEYFSDISVDKVHQKYQNEVERTIPESLKQGIKGWEVTDIKITLIDGEDHQIHSRPGDFVIAAPMGIMNGLLNTGTTLLEPMVSFKISAPEEFLGKIAGDITQMRGKFESPEIENEKFILTGIMPLATSLEYPVILSSRSGGKAKISTKFHSYQECSDEDGSIRKFKGISPLDTAKYILKARKALQ